MAYKAREMKPRLSFYWHSFSPYIHSDPILLYYLVSFSPGVYHLNLYQTLSTLEILC